MATSFDTLAFLEDLKAGGIGEGEATAMTHAFARATSQQLATKSDIDLLRKDLESFYWKTVAGVAALLLVNLGAVWGIVATYASRIGH